MTVPLAFQLLLPLTAFVVGLVAFADVITPMSGAQVRATMVSTLKTLGVPADQWRPGGTYSTILTVLAYAIATFLGLLAQGLGAGFLETASGGWLTLLAYYVYGVTRPGATVATGTVTLVNSGGGTYTYNAQKAIFGNPTTGAQYVNTNSFTLNPGATLVIAIQALVPGSSSSSPVGAISQLVTTMLGVTCGNTAPVVGADQMGDPQLRQLCISALGAMSVRGPRTAYAYAVQVAINPVTNGPVNINRWWVSPADHQGNVTVYIAGPDGTTDSNDILGVKTSIEAIARPDGVTVTVLAATQVLYSGAPTVWCAARPGLSQPTVQAAVDDAVAQYFTSYPIGGLSKAAFALSGVFTYTTTGLFASGLDGAIRSADPGIFAIDGTFDQVLAPGQVSVDNLTPIVLVVPQRGSA